MKHLYIFQLNAGMANFDQEWYFRDDIQTGGPRQQIMQIASQVIGLVFEKD